MRCMVFENWSLMTKMTVVLTDSGRSEMKSRGRGMSLPAARVLRDLGLWWDKHWMYLRILGHQYLSHNRWYVHCVPGWPEAMAECARWKLMSLPHRAVGMNCVLEGHDWGICYVGVHAVSWSMSQVTALRKHQWGRMSSSLSSLGLLCRRNREATLVFLKLGLYNRLKWNCVKYRAHGAWQGFRHLDVLRFLWLVNMVKECVDKLPEYILPWHAVQWKRVGKYSCVGGWSPAEAQLCSHKGGVVADRL